MKNKKEFRENCAAYVLGALDEKELKEFERFLQQADEEYLEIYREYRDTAMQLPLAVSQNPPEHIRKQILDTVQKRSEPKPTVENWLSRLHRDLGLHKPATALSALAALFLLSFGLLMYSLLLHYNSGEPQHVMELQDELTVTEEYLSILGSRQIEYVQLDGAEHVSAAFGRLICDLDQKQALLQISNLPPLPEDKVYQLWLIKNDMVVNKGIVAPRENRVHNFFKINDFTVDDSEENDYFAITMEPRSGVSEPSGEIMMQGSPMML